VNRIDLLTDANSLWRDHVTRAEIQFLDRVADFVQAEVAPEAEKWEQAEELPRKIFERAGKVGLLGVTVPGKFGGQGLGYVAYALAIREVARFQAALAIDIAAHNALSVGQILNHGTPAQLKRVFPRLVNGAWLGAWALTEPEAGSDSAGVQTTAIIAPVWMAISNTLTVSPVKSSKEPARIRWPVLEMGRNSVSPSTMPMIAALIHNEHPQIAALVLAHLEAPMAADVLQMLPTDVQPDVIYRVARLENVGADALQELERILVGEVSRVASAPSPVRGGASEAAKIMTNTKPGIDQRIIDKFVTMEISIGDYVLTGGETAAMVVIDTVVRLIPGVLGDSESALTDSFQTDNGFDAPVYTRPASFMGMDVPEVLLNGNHKDIQEWRNEQGSKKFKKREK
jgi:hypothetical protein